MIFSVDIAAEIVPAFGDRRAAAITRTEVREWSERLADYVKLILRRGCVVVSFHEDEGGDDEEGH